MVFRRLTIDQQVIHHPTVGIAHHAVQDLTGLHPGYLIRKDMVYKSFCIRAGNEDFAHVRHIEHSHILPDGQVFLGDTGILDGHVEPGKGAHFGSKGHVAVMQTGNFQILFHLFIL